MQPGACSGPSQADKATKPGTTISVFGLEPFAPDSQLGRHCALEHEAVHLSTHSRHIVVRNRQQTPGRDSQHHLQRVGRLINALAVLQSQQATHRKALAAGSAARSY